MTKIPFMVPHFLLSYLPWNTLQCLHWKCMLEWKAVNMSFLMTKVGLNVLFSINQSVPSQHYASTAICVPVFQCNKPTQRHLRPRCPTSCDDHDDMYFLNKWKVVILKTKVGKFLTDRRIFSENNPSILIGTHIFILNQLHKNTW
jgi:hypothetical protein